jgi:hypothetical protein
MSVLFVFVLMFFLVAWGIKFRGVNRWYYAAGAVVSFAIVGFAAPKQTPAEQAKARQERNARIAARKPVSNVSPDRIERTKRLLMDEPKIKDVMYQPDAAVQWTVGVMDDGTSRNGFASYVCEVLHEQKVSNSKTIVRVVDILDVISKSRGVGSGQVKSLGSMDCTTYKPFD